MKLRHREWGSGGRPEGTRPLPSGAGIAIGGGPVGWLVGERSCGPVGEPWWAWGEQGQSRYRILSTVV